MKKVGFVTWPLTSLHMGIDFITLFISTFIDQFYNLMPMIAFMVINYYTSKSVFSIFKGEGLIWAFTRLLILSIILVTLGLAIYLITGYVIISPIRVFILIPLYSILHPIISPITDKILLSDISAYIEQLLNDIFSSIEQPLSDIFTCIEPALNYIFTCIEPALNYIFTYIEPALNYALSSIEFSPYYILPFVLEPLYPSLTSLQSCMSEYIENLLNKDKVYLGPDGSLFTKTSTLNPIPAQSLHMDSAPSGSTGQTSNPVGNPTPAPENPRPNPLDINSVVNPPTISASEGWNVENVVNPSITRDGFTMNRQGKFVVSGCHRPYVEAECQPTATYMSRLVEYVVRLNDGKAQRAHIFAERLDPDTKRWYAEYRTGEMVRKRYASPGQAALLRSLGKKT